jgi:chlorophyll(ide) b reductase
MPLARQVNNAGSNAYKYGPLLEAGDDELRSIVETNVLGVMLCCKTAIQLMAKQPGGGHIFNMDGAGSDGNATPRFAAYGATKRSLEQLGKSLAAELKMAGQTKIGLHNLSPGMVTTELLMSGANTPTAKFFINALGARNTPLGWEGCMREAGPSYNLVLAAALPNP